jgi:hypothetical protein
MKRCIGMQIYASNCISARMHACARLLRGYAHTHMLTLTSPYIEGAYVKLKREIRTLTSDSLIII